MVVLSIWTVLTTTSYHTTMMRQEDDNLPPDHFCHYWLHYLLILSFLLFSHLSQLFSTSNWWWRPSQSPTPHPLPGSFESVPPHLPALPWCADRWSSSPRSWGSWSGEMFRLVLSRKYSNKFLGKSKSKFDTEIPRLVIIYIINSWHHSPLNRYLNLMGRN